MTFQRIALVGGWALVSLLAVVGFATFTAPDEGQPVEVADFELPTDLGANAGAVSALAFSYLVEGEVERPPATLPVDEAPATSSTPDDRVGSTFVRSRSLTESEVREIVGRHFHREDVNRAIRVAWCESSFNPQSVSSATGAAGLFRLDPAHWAERSALAGYTGADIFDPEANVAVAAWMVYNMPEGWTAWSCDT